MSEQPGALAGRAVLVTGASRGIGAATALRIARLGGRIVRMARGAMPPLDGALDIRVDLADPRARDAALRKVLDDVGVPDVIVSNAGAFVLAPLAETTDALFREQLAINLEAPFAIARQFLPRMADRGHGMHVLIGSVADHRAYAGNAAYAASKFGVRGLHEVLCEEFRGTGVRCALVSPGPTDTSVWDPINPDANPGFTPRASMLRPDDVAAAIVHVITAPVHAHVESVRLGPA